MEKKRKLSLERKHNLTGWAFLLPAAILIFLFLFLSHDTGAYAVI